MFKIPSMGYKRQILSGRLLKILTSQKDDFRLLQNKICSLSLNHERKDDFCLLQNKICSLSLHHENLNMLL